MNDHNFQDKLVGLQGLLQCQLRGRLFHVRVLQRDGHIALQGVATSYYAKQLAQHLALNTLQSAVLVNEIEVQPIGQGRRMGRPEYAD